MPHLYGRVKVTVTGLAEDWEAVPGGSQDHPSGQGLRALCGEVRGSGYSTSRVEAAKHPLAKRVL